MKIKKIKIKNFRLLKNSKLDMQDSLSLLIGRNNSGKTSFLVLFEKFYKNESFNYNDFSLSLREQILNITSETNIYDLSIQLILEINYTESDNLEYLSEFILDLDPDNNTVNIIFELIIKKDKILTELNGFTSQADKERFIKKNLHSFLTTNIYSFEHETDLLPVNRYKLIKKDLGDIKRIINFQIIHAKRNVSSSDDNKGKKLLSSMTTKYFNKRNNDDPNFSAINQKMIDMDTILSNEYETEFNDFLNDARNFLGLNTLKVISDLESNEVMENSSKVVYGQDANHLPEHLNGLGFMNILYLLLDIEMKKENFIQENKDINLLFIEEPEAHTHPQMQYKFIDEIKKVFARILNLQTIITTHSSQILSKCDFKDIRYLLNENNENIRIKNFHIELEAEYGADEEAEFKFIEQYLTLQASELFFANKIIFIEGTTEKMLLPYYMNKFDANNTGTEDYIPLSSQNISIIEVGANAKAFDKLIQFLGIKTLIITDIDTTQKTIITTETTERTVYNACKVNDATHISNATIKSYFNAPEDIHSTNFTSWLSELKSNSLINNTPEKVKIYYQIEEGDYHARSFEDAFIKINLELIKEHRDDINGLKNKKDLDTQTDIYILTESILSKKSDFAFSILYLALSENIDWAMPKYIKDGLEWIQQ